MNKIKRIKIILLISIPIIIVLAIFVIRKIPSTKKTTTSTMIPTPNISRYYSTKLPINVVVKKENVNLPNEAKLLSFSTLTISEADAKTIAKNLGFGFEPKIINSTLYGKRFFWNSDKNSLYVSLETGNISFGTHNPPTPSKKILSDVEITEISQEFIKKNIGFIQNFYNPLSISYLKRPNNLEGSLIETNRENADTFTINYIFNRSKFEIISLSQKFSPYNLTTLPDGQVIAFNFDKISEVRESPINYLIKNFDDIGSSIDQASLINVDGIYSLESQLPATSISSIDIYEINIGYLMQPDDYKNLIPVIILKGDLKKMNDNRIYKARLFMPALKS